MANEAELAVVRHYTTAPPAPASQSAAAVEEKSAGCVSCHTRSDALSMHTSPAVRLGCADCHGGNAAVRGDAALGFDHASNVAARDKAHVLPRFPKAWNYPSSANPEHGYTLLNRESPEFVRFVNDECVDCWHVHTRLYNCCANQNTKTAMIKICHQDRKSVV